ncbi:hypothetical protein [Photobacterium sp. R1]
MNSYLKDRVLLLLVSVIAVIMITVLSFWTDGWIFTVVFGLVLMQWIYSIVKKIKSGPNDRA